MARHRAAARGARHLVRAARPSRRVGADRRAGGGRAGGDRAELVQFCSAASATRWRRARSARLIAIANTGAVVGFGGVAKLTSGFQAAVDAMTSLPGSPLIGAAIAVSVIAGLTGHPPAADHRAAADRAAITSTRASTRRRCNRVVAISSGGLRLAAAQRLRRDDGSAGDLPRVVFRGHPLSGALTVIVPVTERHWPSPCSASEIASAFTGSRRRAMARGASAPGAVTPALATAVPAVVRSAMLAYPAVAHDRASTDSPMIAPMMPERPADRTCHRRRR